MLGIKVDVELKDSQYPIYFDGVNECVQCGSKGTVVIVDIGGSSGRHSIRPLDHMRCTKCGALYSIKWVPNKDGSGMHPCGVNPSIARQFSNFVIGKITKFDKELCQTIGHNG